MKRIEFKPGYYEWNVFVDGEYFYTFGDSITENIPYDATYENVENVVEDYIDYMEISLINDDKDILDYNSKMELKKQMIKALMNYCGVLMEN